MKPIQAFSLAVVMLAAPASAFAASDTTTPTSPTMSAPNVPSHDGNSQLGSTGTSHAQTSTGVTVGPGSANHGDNQPLGYAKGAGESSSVGKER